MENPLIVIDNGSDTLKVGYSGEDGPRTCFQTVAAKLASPDLNDEELSIYLSEGILNKDSSSYKLSYPIQYGTINHWQDMEYLWGCCYSNKLEIKSEEYGVLMTEGPLNPKPNREKTVHVMFEEFKVPQFYVANQMLLALYASGRTTGVILDIGHNVTHAVPAYEGYTLPHAITQVDFGGVDLTEKVKKELKEENLDERVIRDIKEKCCRVPFYEGEAVHFDKKYALPDGEVVSISDSIAKCPELLFNQFNSDHDGFQGIHDMIYKAVQRCDVCIRKDFYCNIVLSGGSSLFKGIDERLQYELYGLVPSGMFTKIVKNGDRKLETWIGGSIMGSLTTFQPMLISKEEYEEHGPSIVHRKCY